MDESLITGESKPVEKHVGDEVIGATVNLSNTLYIKVTKTGSDTMLAQIIEMVENAQSSRAPVQQMADRIASKFVPVVILISIAVFVGWMLCLTYHWISKSDLDAMMRVSGKAGGGGNSKAHKHHEHSHNVFVSLMFSISVLVISCPCALGLATPTEVMVGTGKAAEFGILFKNGEALERASHTRVMVFDKTGTLTQGVMKVVKKHVDMKTSDMAA